MLPALWEIVIPLILAVLLGIFIGWLIWRWRRQVISETEWLVAQQKIRSLESDLETTQADLDACRASKAEADDDDEPEPEEPAVEEEPAEDPPTDEGDPETNWHVGETTLGTPGAAHKDDLKVVNGIGPKMEELLNSFGIQSWEQLAWLNPEQVQTVDDALQEFPGRIERDAWVPQAKELVERFPNRADRPTRATFLNRSADSNPQ
ncbi:MAG: hypothetical protein AAGC53_19260 [Actinomycetota bacterium]